MGRRPKPRVLRESLRYQGGPQLNLDVQFLVRSQIVLLCLIFEIKNQNHKSFAVPKILLSICIAGSISKHSSRATATYKYTTAIHNIDMDTAQQVMDGAQNCVSNNCCDCWKEGCGCNAVFGVVADGLEAVNPCMEWTADLIWILGSPLAFPIVFCFGSDPESDPPGGGWQIPMIMTPIKTPLRCCFYTACAPCGQWWLRKKLLNNDMTKYKLWQGYHDGPHCLATRCPNAPITIKAGTYNEHKCPNTFLAAEVCCLGCAFSVCCSSDVNRRMMKDERNLGNDPLENRVNNCIGFFAQIMHHLYCCGMCTCCASCLIGCCAPNSEGAQECSGEGGRAARACFSCAHTCFRGIWSVKMIAMGCMSSQMDVEMKEGQPLVRAPTVLKMDRGGGADDEEEDDWWKDPRDKLVNPNPKPKEKKKSKKKKSSRDEDENPQANQEKKKKKTKKKKARDDDETKRPYV